MLIVFARAPKTHSNHRLSSLPRNMPTKLIAPRRQSHGHLTNLDATTRTRNPQLRKHLKLKIEPLAKEPSARPVRGFVAAQDSKRPRQGQATVQNLSWTAVFPSDQKLGQNGCSTRERSAQAGEEILPG